MNQYEAVLTTLERLGGQATLGELYREVLKIKDCQWKTKTPFASIRRIVQTHKSIFRIRPGLWALESYRHRLGLEKESVDVVKENEINHSYYQGLIATIGNLKGFQTFLPNQDKNKKFVNKSLNEIRTMKDLPLFSYPSLVKRSSTVDVIWFNQRIMPDSFFEVEYSTDIQSSLLKYFDLQDFSARMFIVANKVRESEFKQKVELKAFTPIKERIKFLDFDNLVRRYELEIFRSEAPIFL